MTAGGEPTGYGLGRQVGETGGARETGHGGAQQGTSTYLSLYPERGVAIAVLCNLERAKPGQLAHAIDSLFLPE